MEHLQLSLSLAEKEAQIIRIKMKMLENKGDSSESPQTPPTPQTPQTPPVSPKPLPEESLPIPPEESKIFSEDGREAVKEMKEQLKGKYDIKSYTHKGTKDAFCSISKDGKTVIIENHDQEARNDFGLITTLNEHYSDEGSSIIEEWAGFGRTIQRKQYNFKGKNIVQTLSIIDKLLS